MTDDVTERLTVLEQHVRQAIELIGTLRAENARLAARVALLEREAATLRQREEGLAPLKAEHRRLVAERRELLGQVEGVLKELARIEGL